MVSMGRVVLAVVVGVAGIAGVARGQATQAGGYDLVVRNGRVLDGTGSAWFYADVAVRGGRIAKLARPGTAKGAVEIDAGGRVVAPGFIDVHTHADEDVLRNSAAENFVRDGVTTIVSGNCGGSVGDVGKYLAAVDAKGAGVNVATLVGHNTVLRATKGDKAGALTDEQMEAARGIVRKGMEDGAVGFSTGLIYTPGKYSDTAEIVELAKVAGEFGGIYASHMRSEGMEILAAIDEALTVGREAGCRVEISHFKLPVDAARKLGGAEATLGKVMAARAAGQEVWLDQYPYTASQTTLTTLLPDWVAEAGAEAAKKTLADEGQVAKVVADMGENYVTKRGRKDMAYVVIASCKAYPQYVGKNVKQIAQAMKVARASAGKELIATDPAGLPDVTMDEQFRAIIDICQKGGAACVFHTMAEPEVEQIMRSPLVSIASDSGIRDFGQGQPHPRGYGTNARVLGEYVRERKVISLEEAVRKMTSQPALAFRLKDRGVIREGAWADVVVFDPAVVSDKATFERPHQYSVGMEWVIVNGKVEVEGGKMTGVRGGRGVRREE